MAEPFYKRARRYALYKLSTTAPVNTVPPALWDTGGGYLMCDYGKWNQYPVDFKPEWYLDGQLVAVWDTFYKLPAGKTMANISLKVTASNDKGSTVVTVP